MTDPLIPLSTIGYKTYVKKALVESLRAVFANHPDDVTVRNATVGIDFPMTEADYPSIVIRFYERKLRNAGIAHREWLSPDDGGTGYHPFKHILYNGDIEFAIYALSSMDRDIMTDALVQTLMMADIESYTQAFLDRIYAANPNVDPYSREHYINLNTDEVQGFGEQQQIAPWMPEDVLVYQTSYRLGIFGEFYSLAPSSESYGVVEAVETYPYMPVAGEPVPDPDPENPTPWVEG